MIDINKEQLINIRDRITQNKCFPYLVAILRGILIFTFYALMCGIVISNFKIKFAETLEEFFSYPIYIRTALEYGILILMLNSVILTFSIYNKLDRESFLKIHHEDSYFLDVTAERKLLLRSNTFWMELVTMWGLFLLFPTLSGYIDIFKIAPALQTLSPALKKGLVLVIFAVSSLLLTLHSRIDSRKMWLETPKRMMQKSLWKSLERKLKGNYSYFRMVLRLVGYMLIYNILIPVAVFVIAFFVSLLRVIFVFAFEPVLFGLLIALIVLIYFRTFHTRVKFIKRLKKTCKENRFELLELKRPYRSIFRDNKSYTFAVRANGKDYYCRILASVKRGNKMIISDDGTCTRAMGLHVPAPNLASAGGFVQGIDRGNGDDREFMKIASVVDYTFEAEGNKVLIINPVPKRVISSICGYQKDMDNGDKVGEYTVYTGNAFLRWLERSSNRDH